MGVCARDRCLTFGCIPTLFGLEANVLTRETVCPVNEVKCYCIPHTACESYTLRCDLVLEAMKRDGADHHR